MRILVSSASYIFSDHLSGGEYRVSYNIVRELVNRRHDVTVIAPKVDLKQQINANIIEIGQYEFKPAENYFRYRLNWWLFSLKSLIKIKKLIKKEKYDIVHHIRPANAYMFSLCWIPGIPFIYGPITPTLKIKEKGFVEYGVEKKANLILGLKTRIFNKFHNIFAPPLWKMTLRKSACILIQMERAKEGIPEEYMDKVKTVGLGVDTDYFAPQEGYRETEVPSILFLANLTRQKGLEYLIKAMPKILKEIPESKLYVVGDGPGRRYLEDSVINLKLEESVKFFGKVPHSETVKYYNMCWVYCLPAIEEPAPNSVLEAMACGIPIVATKSGGIPGIVEEGKSGILVPPGDSDALSEALIILIKDKFRRKEIGTYNRKLAEEKYSIKQLFDKIEMAYKSTILNNY